MEVVKVYDHTCDDIIHEYREDGTLIIYNDGMHENERNYTVEREKDKVIKINDWDAKVTATKLTIDSRPRYKSFIG